MRNHSSCLMCFLLTLCLIFVQATASGSNKMYIVKVKGNSFMHEKRINPSISSAKAYKAYKADLINKHDAILSSLPNTEANVEKAYSYVHVLNGFSASLNEDQFQKLRGNVEVEWVMESRIVKPLTTQSPTFLGLEGVAKPVWNDYIGEDIIIGVVDSGIVPDNPSFHDLGLSAPPSKFKGICEAPISGPEFNCNNKVIGARYFYKGFVKEIGKIPSGEYMSALAANQHGTHVASTAAGSPVGGIYLGDAQYGNASGMAYGARIVAYKVLWGTSGGSTADIIAAFEAGVQDGVDVFSLSLGGDPSPLYYDPNVFVSLKVVAEGIPVIFAAGNAGRGTVANSYPWVLTVAASTFDRSIRNKIYLRNDMTLDGTGSSRGLSLDQNYPLVNGASAAAPGYSSDKAELCTWNSLDSSIVYGKIVLCKNGEISVSDKSYYVKNAGGVGMILYNQQGDTSKASETYYVPHSHVNESDGLLIAEYIASSDFPEASISVGEVHLDVLMAPQIADFSSTGPNQYLPHLIKPDITAPGVDIIAAFKDNQFSFMSGTSMATPHVSGIVALIKSAHPTWKPSWIYSAIITSGYTSNYMGDIKDASGYDASPFHMGGGHINVHAALDPGLVYNMDPKDYDNFLCTRSGGYYENIADYCSHLMREIDFNLPYLSLPEFNGTTTVTRSLTLVGSPSVFEVHVVQPVGAQVLVTPASLEFTEVGQTLSYDITVKSLSPCKCDPPYDVSFGFTFGTITWFNDNGYYVKFNVAVNVI